MLNQVKLGLIGFISVALLSACGGKTSSSKPSDESSNGGSLTIIHINDHHSHLDESTLKLKLAGEKTYTKVGGFPRVAAAIKNLRTEHKDAVTIHAGDAITGDLYYALFKGEADAALMNEVCFDYFALGNHEFDDGDAGLKRFLDYLAQGDCNTQVLAANVIPKVGVSPLAAKSTTDYFKAYSVKEIAGEKVGFIGIDIANKTKNSSSPDKTTQFLDEAKTAQKYIDELKTQGVNRVVLITHYQYENDKKLAAKLDGVDVIIGGDSHSLLGSFSKYGLDPAGSYPTQVKDKSGNLVCIAQAWEYSHVVGSLSVTFDKDGVVTRCEGTPYLLVGDSFKRKKKVAGKSKKVELQGDEREAVLNAIKADKQLQIVAEDAPTKAKLDEFSGQVDELKKAKIGTAKDELCLVRIPGGKNRGGSCDSQTGSDIANLVAQAFLEMAVSSDVSIQNAGGVRIHVPKGDITIGTAYTLLPFANTIFELDMSGAEIKATLEDAIDFAIAEGGSTGAYPYAAGLRWKVAMGEVKGQRVYALEVKAKGSKSWSKIHDKKLYKVATNSYIAGGKDGYITMGKIAQERRLDTYLDYAQSFVNYVNKKGSISKPKAEDYSTQAFTKGKK